MSRHSVLLLLLSLLAVNAYAVPINLGTASTFGLLGGASVTNTGSSVINGDVGSSPTPSVSGFPPGIVNGTLYTAANAVTAQAQSDLTVAYLAAAAAPCPPTHDLTGIDLGTFNAGNPLLPGVYCFSTTAGLTGNLTLDGQGDPNAQWIFQVGSSLTTAASATVSFINGASPCNVFWQIGISATIGGNNVFGGTIMAGTSITLGGGTLNGRALARIGSVTISAAEFVNPVCAAGPCVTVAKAADTEVASAGDLITYTYTVCNCGLAALTVGSVVDSRLGNLTADFIAANGGTAVLAPSACALFTETYTVLLADTSPLVNTVAVSAGSGGVVVGDTAQASVIITSPGPCVTISKRASRAVASVGDFVSYTYTVCNCGTVPLTVSSVIDSRLGDLIADFIAANLGSAILATDTCVTFVETVTVTVFDASPLTNSVTVSATDGATTVTGAAQASVTLNPGRRCFLPVTLTQQKWHDFAASAPGVPGGLIYNVFPSAFARYGYFGAFYTGQVIIGAPQNVISVGGHSIAFTATTSGLTQLRNFLPQIGPADRLWGKFINPSYLLSRFGAKTSNVLAGELLALTLNIAYNDMRLMPRSKGYDLERFILTQGTFKGKTVGQVWNIANAILSGAPPCTYGLTTLNALVSILQSINANYEFVDITTFIDRGYLTPNGPLGQPGPSHPMIVPF